MSNKRRILSVLLLIALGCVSAQAVRYHIVYPNDGYREIIDEEAGGCMTWVSDHPEIKTHVNMTATEELRGLSGIATTSGGYVTTYNQTLPSDAKAIETDMRAIEREAAVRDGEEQKDMRYMSLCDGCKVNMTTGMYKNQTGGSHILYITSRYPDADMTAEFGIILIPNHEYEVTVQDLGMEEHS